MKKKLTLLLLGILLSFSNLLAQDGKNVTGTVTEPDGTPLIGVNVVIKGTSNGTTTNLDGKYSLVVPNNDAILVFSFIGYLSKDVAVGTQTTINVSMEEDAEQLDEVVVSALGFTIKKDQLGSTSSQVQTKDATRSGEALFLNSLAAKASNVQINAVNGDPGAGTSIRIRGANTISGSSNPLIILDGAPISNSTLYGGGNNATGGRTGGVSQQSRLNDINPNDIESIQILKGASAASLWGSRAANGVLVITTKSGKEGRMKISYKSSLSFDEVNRRIDMQNTWGQGRSGVYSPTRAEAWGDYIPDRSGGADEINTTGQYYEARDGSLYYPITGKNSTETFDKSNWDAVFQTGQFWQNDLSISGGTEKATYFLSLGRLAQEGIIRNSDYERNNVRFNTKFHLTDWFTVSSKAGYTKSKSNRIQQSSNTAGLLLGLLRTPPDFDNRDYIGTYYSSDGTPFTNRQRSYRRYLGNNSNPIYNNPLWTINEQTAESNVNRFIFNTEFNLAPTEWMQIILRGGLDNSNDKRAYLFPIGSAGDRNPGIFVEDLINEQELNFDAIAKGSFNLTDDISLQATLGWNINDRQRSFNTSELTGFLVDSKKPTTALNTAAGNTTISNNRRFVRSNRAYSVMSFDLYDQLFVNMSGALEAASTVKGTFFYPSVDAAWQLTKAIDLGNTPITFAKLRASFGQVGVQPQPHRFQTLAESGFSYSTYSDPLDVSLFGGGYRLDDDKGNPDLEPEIKTEWEVGLDTRLFNDKLTLGMTYYQNKIDGILISVALTPSSGFDTEYSNAAAMENKGFELETDYSIYKNGDWDIGMYANFASNENKVTDLSGTQTIDLSGASVSSRAIVGQSLGVLFGTGSQTDDNGNFVLDDNGFPQITPSPIILGDPNPDWNGGLGLRASWKGVNLNVLFEHSQGGDFSPRTQWVLRRFGTTQETANRVTLDQDITNYAGNVIPAGSTVRGNITDFGGGSVLLDESWYRTGIGGGFGDNQAYNFSIQDATFTRLRELSVGYTLNSQGFRNKTKLSSVTFTATGRNLFLWTDLQGIDPSTNQTGISNARGLDYFTNPSTRSIVFSISVNY